MKVIAILLLVCSAAAHAGTRDPVKCLTDNVYYEAANEPLSGQVAVAQVTLNRVAAGYGSDICSAVYYRIVNASGKKVAAFSWTLGAAWRAPGPVDADLYARCRWIAESVLNGALHAAIGPRVIYYHAVYVHPHWVHKQFIVQIGQHRFYR